MKLDRTKTEDHLDRVDGDRRQRDPANAKPFLERVVKKKIQRERDDRTDHHHLARAEGDQDPGVEGRQRRIAVFHRALDLVDDPGAGAQQFLSGQYFATAEPPFEEVEEMDAVLDEDAAAFLSVPEPVVGAQGLVLGRIGQHGMQRVTQDAGLHQGLHGLAERVVAHDQVHGENAPAFGGEANQSLRINHGGRERLFT